MIKFKIFLYMINLVNCDNNKININDINIHPLTEKESGVYLRISNDPRIKYQSLSFTQEKIEKEKQFKYKFYR